MKNSEKARVGRLLTNFIKEIAQEKIVQEDFDDRTVAERVVTKAEALSRIIWRDALGWVEITGEGKQINHKPDKSMIQLIYERMEGKVGSIDDHRRKDISIPKRVSDVAKVKINKLSNNEQKK